VKQIGVGVSKADFLVPVLILRFDWGHFPTTRLRACHPALSTFVCRPARAGVEQAGEEVGVATGVEIAGVERAGVEAGVVADVEQAGAEQGGVERDILDFLRLLQSEVVALSEEHRQA